MRVLAFRHVPFEGAGLIELALQQRGISLDYADLHRDGAQLPETGAYDGLIFLGGPMSVNDPLPFLKTEMGVLDRAIAAATPVLGVCLGAQLIAKTLGARVYRNRAPEIGWFDVHFTPSARHDTVFAGLDPVETLFHWHSDTFDLPAGAELLASSERTERQAFQYGPAIYGLQFHLEVTPEMIVNWCKQDRNCGDVRELSALPDPWKNRDRLDRLAAAVFGQWCGLLSARTK